jgi:hypothetical protein
VTLRNNAMSADIIDIAVTLLIVLVFFAVVSRSLEATAGAFFLALLLIVIGRKTYRIDDSGIRIFWLWTIPVMRINFGDILEIREASASHEGLRYLFAAHMGNRILLPIGKMVIIRRSRGWRKTVLLTPRNPREFVQAVNQRLSQIRPT